MGSRSQTGDHRDIECGLAFRPGSGTIDGNKVHIAFEARAGKVVMDISEFGAVDLHKIDGSMLAMPSLLPHLVVAIGVRDLLPVHHACVRSTVCSGLRRLCARGALLRL